MAHDLWAELAGAQGYHAPAALVARLAPQLVPWLASCVRRHGGLGLPWSSAT